MILTRLALRNPVAVLMVCISLVVLAVLSATRIPVDMFPSLDIPAIRVNTNYPGATPEEVERSITYPLERAVSRVSGIVRVESESEMGDSDIDIWFGWDANLNTALVQVISEVQRAMDDLPPGVEAPSVAQVDVSDFAVVQIAMEAPTLSPKQQYELADIRLAPQLQRLPGVSDVVVRGGLVRQINIECDPHLLQARGLSLQDVREALAQSNRLIPSGGLRNQELDYQLQVRTLLESVEEIADVVITVRQGTPIKVRDVATVVDGVEDADGVFRVDDREGVGLWVLMQPRSNLIELARSVREAVPRLAGVPEGVELKIVFDQSESVEEAIDGLSHEALFGGLLVSLVVLVFLRNLTSVAIICIGIPLAVAAALMMMYFGDQTLNIFTLGGLTLALGRLVDDAIVVRENITRHLERGDQEAVSQVVLRATSEVAMPVLAATLTTIAVFFPVVFLEGVAKKMFVPLALTIIFSMAASYVVSMTVDPVLSVAWLRGASRRNGHSLGRPFELALIRLESAYEATLRLALRRPLAVTVLLLGCLASGAWLAPAIPTEFFPENDESLVILRFETQLGTGLEATEKIYATLADALQEEVGPEERLGLLGYIGSPSNQGRMFLKLRPPQERRRSTAEISRALRSRLADLVPGIRLLIYPGGRARRILNFGSDAPIDVQLLGFDQDVGSRLADQVAAAVGAVPGVVDLRVSPQGRVPAFKVTIDGERAALLGLTPVQVASTVNTAISGGALGQNRFVDPVSGNEFNLVTRLDERFRRQPEDLGAIPIATLFPQLRSRAATPITLRDVATVELGAAPVAILRKNQQRVIQVTADTTRPLGEVSGEIHQVLEEMEFPEGFVYYLGGQTEQQQGTFQSMLLAGLLALLLVYAIMASQFGTLWEPLVIMFTVPLGLVGVVWIQAITGTSFSVMSFMGVIMMTGIVVSNGILLVEFAKNHRSEASTLEEAVVLAGRTRLRPILMTAISTIVGMIPMAVGLSGGSAINGPLALAVIGGLMVSTALTLVVVPVFYRMCAERIGSDSSS